MFVLTQKSLTMQEQDHYTLPTPRNTEEILKTYNHDAQQMRAKAAKARIAARHQADRDARQRAALEQVPPEHRI